MPWTSYFPDSPESLTRLEWRLWILAGVFTVITVLLGLAARGVAHYKTRILEQRLTRTLEERDTKTKQLEQINAEARQKVAEVEARQAPRRLSQAQQAQLVALLSSEKGTLVRVIAPSGDAEAFTYADDLLAALKEARWPTEPAVRAFIGSHPAGVFVYVKDHANPAPGAVLLLGSFQRIGVEVQGVGKPSLDHGVIELVVSNKPR